MLVAEGSVSSRPIAPQTDNVLRALVFSPSGASFLMLQNNDKQWALPSVSIRRNETEPRGAVAKLLQQMGIQIMADEGVKSCDGGSVLLAHMVRGLGRPSIKGLGIASAEWLGIDDGACLIRQGERLIAPGVGMVIRASLPEIRERYDGVTHDAMQRIADAISQRG